MSSRKETPKYKIKKKGILWFCAALAVVLGSTAAITALNSASGSDDQPYLPVVVGLGGSSTPVKVGVIVSANSDAHQGADYFGGAAGVRIAEYRYRQAGAKVQVIVVDDHGTDEGARAAAKQLINDGVDGIVYASVGSHLRAGLKALADAGTCAVLPYADETYTVPDKVWLTGPSDKQRSKVFADVIVKENLTSPPIITDGSIPGTISEQLTKSAMQKVTAASQLAAPQTKNKKGDTGPVVVWASAQLTADLLARIGGFGHTGITLVGPDAMTPAFASALLNTSLQQGTVSVTNRYVTVGASTALIGKGPSDFVAAQQLASQDSGTKALLGETTLSANAYDADMLSHDAVVSIVNAARMTNNPSPAETCKHLAGQKVVSGEGLAGPDLSFDSPTTFPDDAVTEVQATRTRRADQSVALAWFPVPHSGSSK